MRFEVPQFIEIEDKIFGPLTWRQFVYIAGGIGMIVVLFLLTPRIVFIIFLIPVAALSFLLSFYPVNNQPFSHFLESVVQYFKGTKLYLWRKKGTGVYGSQTETAGSPAYVPPSVSKDNISSLARRLELKSIQKTN